MLKYANRVKESSTDMGTTAFDLDGAVLGFQTFIAGIGTTNQCKYTIEAVTSGGTPTGEWEVGFGTVTAGSPDTLTRDVVEESSNTNALVDFGVGNKFVFLAPVASGSQEHGCRLKLAGDFSVDSGPTNSPIDFTGSDYTLLDTDSFHNPTAGAERIIIPPGLDGIYVCSGMARWEASAGGTYRRATIEAFDSGDTKIDGTNSSIAPQGAGTIAYAEVTLILKLVAGDYVVLQGSQDTGGALNVTGGADSTLGWSQFSVVKAS